MLNEQENVFPAYEKLRKIFEQMPYSWEIICIDDGSTDETFPLIQALSEKDSRVRGLRLSRNFGFHAAATAGFSECRGNCAFTVSADTQEPIELLPQFIQKNQEGYEVVWGVRTQRNDPWMTRLFANIFYAIFSRLGMLDRLPRQAAFVLIDRTVIDALALFPEQSRMLWGIIAWMGFKQTQIMCPFGGRENGQSRWTFGKRVKLAIDTFTAFSYAPIRIVSFLGIVIATLGFIYGSWLIVHSFTSGVTVQGWPTLMVTILFLSGLQLLVCGIMGEYIWRCVEEGRRRPLYLVSDRTERSLSRKTSDNRELLQSEIST